MAVAMQTTENLAWIGLGANLGDPPATLAWALEQIGQLPGTAVAAASALYRSAPVDAQGPDFFNAVCRVRTLLEPLPLLHALLAIEQQAGRERPWRNAPRTLDLDLLCYARPTPAPAPEPADGQPLWQFEHCTSAELTLPHPRMHQRAFVLRPLADIDATLVHPQWLMDVTDQRIEKAG